MMRLFQKADAETELFATNSGLKCKTGCGHCCENPNIETTVLEMIPVALDLLRRNESREVLNRLTDSQPSGVCTFYRRDPFKKDHGRCSIYPFRPLICRLFGFSATMDKHQQNIFMTCQVIKDLYPEEYEKVSAAVKADRLPIARLRDFSMKVFSIDPVLGNKRLPINDALRIALEKIGLFLDLKSQKENT